MTTEPDDSTAMGSIVGLAIIAVATAAGGGVVAHLLWDIACWSWRLA
jgi:uncharacterized membrane protein YeiH